MKKLWVAWEDGSSVRSRVLAGELGAEFLALTHFTRSRAFGWLRYPTAGIQTVWAMLSRRPDLLVVQNPSILLAFQAALLKPLFRYRLVIDLHTQFLRLSGVKKRLVDALHVFGLRHCDVVVVTNEAYAARVRTQTPRPVLVLPDRIPSLDAAIKPATLRRGRSVLYICTFSGDEPWREVVAAAAQLPPDSTIYISGRSPLRQDALPENVVLTGFLATADYQNLLRSVDAVMVLTTADENLVCGGYEAVSAGKPLILSDTRALRTYFSRGTVFTRNTGEEIAAAITRAHADSARLTSEITMLKGNLMADWEQLWRLLLSQVGATERPGGQRAVVAG